MKPSIKHLLAFSFIRISFASYCGQATIPFTFQVLHSGLRVLGCAQPLCFGWNANGTRAVQTAQFYKISGKEDGYIRRSDQMQQTMLRNSVANPRVANCEEHYSMKNCAPGQWVGGIAPGGLGLQIRCCRYAPLVNSEDRGVAMVTNGQLVVGGEVMDDDDLKGFDYIANIKMEEIQNGNAVYAVSIRRMRCADEETTKEKGILQNAVVLNLDDDSHAMKEEIQMDEKPVRSHHVPLVASSPHQILPSAAASDYHQTWTEVSSPSHLLNSHYLAHQEPNTFQVFTSTQPGHQNYIPFLQVAQPMSHPLGGLFNSAVNTFMTTFPPQLAATPAQPQSQVSLTASTTPLPTFPLLTLDQISKIDIPSVEDVENVIPPVQKAILTTIAKFFGVL